MASTDIMGNFSPMDELIQLIYQNIYQFVVMSSVTFDKWTVYVGMVGEAGRWWRGFWEERDVISVVVNKLVECVVGGDLFLAGFSTERGAKIRLSFGTGSQRPVSMALEEIEAAEAAAHATNVFLEIALQAQSRKCRLHPSTFVSTTSLPTREAANSGRAPSIQSRRIRMKEREKSSGVIHRQLNVSQLSSSNQVPRIINELIDCFVETQPSVRVGAPQGSSKVVPRSNPVKKARKIKAMDFESDDE
ncbi:hypothetical protein AGABI2DRAFT_69774 [Agaricus bisporus var. bisporus H97]|uniref:hypothetical protein n=1 Tax=Agaricus bisporus var. bisporus (strain H97 / ATCC MYA-4626 / FGSC 10389) TaxID=936046 RepID=UPI00029F6C51|nr:hypothetical protein AGABI2DRAFT_69774 [Agaricus bisporus var. bisporus H97]EKV47239.1 hypothetical protein AGABI2DRAFT_69774 [Agaricus bisporus var. bisporus H97]